MLTRQEPTERAVPPIELIKASSFFVSDNKRQQLERTPTLSLTKKLLSDHFILWSLAQRANSWSWNSLSLYNKLNVNPLCSCYFAKITSFFTALCHHKEQTISYT